MGASLERDPNPYSAYWGSRLSPPVTKASLVFLTPVYYGFFYLQVDAQTAIPEWEIIPDFNPRQVVLNSVHWVDKDAKPINLSQGVTAQNEHLPRECIDVISGALPGDLNNLAFRDPQQFVTGQHHNHYDRWCDICDIAMVLMCMNISGISMALTKELIMMQIFHPVKYFQITYLVNHFVILSRKVL